MIFDSPETLDYGRGTGGEESAGEAEITSPPRSGPAPVSQADRATRRVPVRSRFAISCA